MAEERESFITAWKRHLQADKRLGTLVQVGLATSYPLFAHDGQGLVARHFYYPSSRTGPNQVTLSAPQLLVTLALPDLHFVASETGSLGLPPFEDSVYAVPEEEHEAKRALLQRLELLYDEALRAFPVPPAPEVGSQLLDTLQQVVPPALWPYYQRLAPGFTAWLDAA